MRERTVEQYFVDEVVRTGGQQRKCIWGGRKSAPDRFVFWEALEVHAWVELKAPGKEPRPDQLREHARMRRGGCEVYVIDTKEGVDAFIKEKTNARCK